MFSIGIGSKTSTGGEVIEGNNGLMMNGLVASSVGHQATCKSGRRECRGVGPIVAVGPRSVNLPAGPAARVGDYVDCGCPEGSNVLIGSGSVQVGSSSVSSNVDAMSRSSAAVNTAASSMSSASNTSSVSSTVPKINPNNMYWPPYNPLAPEGEREIKLEYTQDIVKFAVLSPDEWAVFFDTFDTAKTLKDTATGLYDARKTAQALGGIGVIAFVRNVDGVEYVVLKNYEYWKQTLLHGGVFKADNPRVVKLGLGALDSARGMVRYVRVTAPMEILVGSSINVLQYIVNDEYTLRQLGVDQAKIFIQILLASGLALGSAALFPVLASTVLYSGITLIVSSTVVWTIDKLTDFEQKFVEKVLELSE
ncbi:PAAR domain-containing protein [Vibrio injensis]|uniref:PAAR domain-containing protein n=1 Tax=Vibrio injensis TaxID=1307414 RepID=UPI00278C0F9D|nr:PAAR domain-containing protein [Vibrio injensis]